MITEKDVDHIAQLARIKLSEQEKQKFQKELELILQYIDKLNQVETVGVEPTAQATGITNSFRADEVNEPNVKQSQELINQAPERKDNLVKVKNILDNK